MNQLLQDLSDRGYQRVGLAIRADFDDRVGHTFIASYLRYQSEQDESDPIEPYVESRNLKQTSFLQWLRADQPDCIVTVGNEIGSWLAKAKIRILEPSLSSVAASSSQAKSSI